MPAYLVCSTSLTWINKALVIYQPYLLWIYDQFLILSIRAGLSNVQTNYIIVAIGQIVIQSASTAEKHPHLHLWSRGYDSRLGLSYNIKCERSQVRVLASAILLLCRAFDLMF
jgi:hypothetical protein